MKREDIADFIAQNGDCPEVLIKMARTKWQKAVAIEFVRQAHEMEKVVNDQKWIKWMVMSIFGLAILGVLSQWFPVISKLLGF